ncbi:MAG TPA: hypothetical protein VI248_01595 [Kineosporiaceae bacterium]
MTRSVLRTVVVTGVAALVLAGCGTPEAGAAATVGGRRISVADVQSATSDVQTLYGQNQPVSQRAVLYLLAAAPYIQEVATRRGAGTSPDEARRIFTQKDPKLTPSDAAVTVLQANGSLGKLDQLGPTATQEALSEVTKELAHDHLTVSPRYGTFDPQRGTLLPDQPNWLPTTATPSPTPSQ